MRGRARTERGESLLELLVAITILGIGVVALLGGLATAVLTSGTHRKQADVSATVTAASEHLKAAPYRTCAKVVGSDGYLETFGFPAGGFSFTIADWNGVEFVNRVVPDPSPPLPCQQFEDLGYREQLITLTFTSPDTKVSRTLSLVKRYRDCPTPASPTPGCG